MTVPLVLFIAEGCNFSRELMNNYGECLLRICDRIFYYNPKDKQIRRKKASLSAIEYHQIRQFPSLVCENGTILQSANSITEALQELCQIQPHPPFTNMQHQQQPDGIGHHSVAPDTMNIGNWPSQDQVSAINQMPSYQQQQMSQAQCYQGGGPQQQQQQQQNPQYANDQQQRYPNPMQNGYDPHQGGNDNNNGQYHGIGGGAMVGASETDMAHPRDPGNTADTASIGDWPAGQVRNYTGGNGGANGGGNQMHIQRDQMNQQQTRMMMNQGVPVSQPYQMY